MLKRVLLVLSFSVPWLMAVKRGICCFLHVLPLKINVWPLKFSMWQLNPYILAGSPVFKSLLKIQSIFDLIVFLLLLLLPLHWQVQVNVAQGLLLSGFLNLWCRCLVKLSGYIGRPCTYMQQHIHRQNTCIHPCSEEDSYHNCLFEASSYR
jgi:hypothetical protein